MKLLSLFLLAATATAAPVTVGWNPNPEPGITYRLYRGLELLGETTATRLEVDLPADQQSTLTVVAVNTAGLVSPPSKRLVVAPVPVEGTPDLATWKNPVTFFHTLEQEGVKTERYFFRFNLTHIQPQ